MAKRVRSGVRVVQAPDPRMMSGLVVHPRLVVLRASGEAILKQTRTGKPTQALRKLMRDGD